MVNIFTPNLSLTRESAKFLNADNIDVVSCPLCMQLNHNAIIPLYSVTGLLHLKKDI